jgi:hypothetical protein
MGASSFGVPMKDRQFVYGNRQGDRSRLASLDAPRRFENRTSMLQGLCSNAQCLDLLELVSGCGLRWNPFAYSPELSATVVTTRHSEHR